MHRKGDFVFPVEAVVKFDNGDSTIERWDGKDRWVRYVYRKKAQVESVQIDPTYQAPMDRDYVNNSRVTESQHGAVHKLATYWMFFTQFLAQMISWLA